jgi:hypothetical protein
MPTSNEADEEAGNDRKTISLTHRSASAQNYLQRKYRPLTRSLSTKPHLSHRSATAIDFKRHKHPHNQTAGLSIHGNHMFYSPYFLSHQRSKSALSFKNTNADPSATPSAVSDEDEKPPQGFWTLLRIGMVYFGIEMIFSIEIALAIPLLLKLKVPEE